MASPTIIEDSNLSHAWARTIAHVLTHPGTEIAPLLVSICGFDEDGTPSEDLAVRAELDQLLKQMDKLSVEMVAYPIFPQRLWEHSNGDRAYFYARFKRAFRSYQASNRSWNGRGWYFQRLVEYGEGPLGGNQLEWIIQQFQGRPGIRRSMLQASIFRPKADHTASAQLGFPCMQHVSFAPSASELSVNAFYATQQLVQKAYGNYVGLAHLGAFVAKALNLRLSQINVFVGIAKVERIPKSDARLKSIIAKVSDPHDVAVLVAGPGAP